jgi:hypothetical protein
MKAWTQAVLEFAQAAEIEVSASEDFLRHSVRLTFASKRDKELVAGLIKTGQVQKLLQRRKYTR